MRTPGLLVFAIILLTIQFGFAAKTSYSEGKKSSVFEFLQREPVLELTFEANFSELKDNRKTTDYSRGVIRLKDKEGSDLVMPLKVKPRGKFRRKICSMPPLKLKFSKDYLNTLGLDTFNNLKLVTPCLDGESASDELVLKEYLAYKLFNILTENSLRAQLLKVKWVDITKLQPEMTTYAILIEDDEELAFRLGGSLCDDCYNPPREKMDIYQAGLAGMFNYMIGNPDWDPAMIRNLEVVQPLDGGKLKIVPYDFDFSGFVNPPYARIPANLGLKSLQDRIYLGPGCSREETESIKEKFRNNSEKILDTCSDFNLLSYGSRRDLVKYLKSFFEVLDHEQIIPEALPDATPQAIKSNSDIR